MGRERRFRLYIVGDPRTIQNCRVSHQYHAPGAGPTGVWSLFQRPVMARLGPAAMLAFTSLSGGKWHNLVNYDNC
jgi:hypothetical protein